MFFVYVLKNNDNKIYIGYTKNIDARLVRHNSNRERYTKNKGPWTLIYKKSFYTRFEAIEYERRLKSGKGREWIRNSLI